MELQVKAHQASSTPRKVSQRQLSHKRHQAP